MPLVAVFLLALLTGFAGRVLLPQQHQSGLSVAGALSALSHSNSTAAVPVVNRRRLIALSSPFRVNPLAGQVSLSSQPYTSLASQLELLRAVDSSDCTHPSGCLITLPKQ
jgi:hypothetical protein